MRKVILSLILTVMLVALTGCSKTVDIKDYAVGLKVYGEITDKLFVPHKDYKTNQYVDGEYRTVEKHEPDMWYLRIQREDGKNILTTDVRVSEEIWNQYGIGDFYGGE